LLKARPSARQAMLPTVISTPANVTNNPTISRGVSARATRYLNPAQHSLLQGFCAHTKT
jgi:hypothetical protein